MILEAALQALQNFATPVLWISMMAGVVVGLVFGIIPGIGGMVAMALFLPFVFNMTLEQALPFMMAVPSVVFIGGSITAILLNLPGVPASAATLLDGFPMAQKGEAGRALGAALTSCGIGSLLTVFIALALVPLLLPMVFAIHNADMVFIILIGLTFIAALGRGSLIKGLISGGLGLLIALIGFQAVTGVSRFTFGSAYLYDGIPLIPVTMGLFAVPEMIALATRGGTIAQTGVVIKGMQQVWQGVRDVFHHWVLVLRSSIIGFIAGLLPGVGAAVASFVAYGHAKQTSKHPERFGTGCVEGVIAPETANDGKEGGALLTTLALGIPGSPAQALLLAAFIMLGLVPGPEMLTTHLDISLTLLYVILVASMIGVIICLPLAPYMAKIATVPGRVLVPLVLVIVFVGTFAYQEQVADIIVLLFFSALGLALRRYGYNSPALFLGYILGALFERYFFLAIGIAGPLFFVRPIALGLIFITVVFFSFKPVKNLLQRKRGVKPA